MTVSSFVLGLVGFSIAFFFFPWLGERVGNTPKYFYYGKLRRFYK